jgi:hypothetical protein
MIEKLHDHILEELKTNTRTDIIFILTAIALNLITLAVNSAVAAESDSTQAMMIFVMFTLLMVMVNIVAVFGLLKGKQTRSKLLEGLIKMYEDKGVAKYYDRSILSNYNTRYILFIIAVAVTGITAITIPFILLT